MAGHGRRERLGVVGLAQVVEERRGRVVERVAVVGRGGESAGFLGIGVITSVVERGSLWRAVRTRWAERRYPAFAPG